MATYFRTPSSPSQVVTQQPFPGSACPPAGSGCDSTFTPAFASLSPQFLVPASTGQPDEEIRTLFVAGFPPDSQQRELHTLLRFFPGYEASQVRKSGKKTKGRC
jgi:hypothetical protein